MSEDAENTMFELSPRQVEVLALISQGLTNQAIAHKMMLSHNTVKTHIRAIIMRLSARNRTHAAAEYWHRQAINYAHKNAVALRILKNHNPDMGPEHTTHILNEILVALTTGGMT
ncbi:MAG: response regulator transcription factor [Candidatus Dormibacteria bacterium]